MSARTIVRSMIDSKSKDALGYMCWWTLHQAEIPLPKMEKLLHETLGDDYMPNKPREKRALRMALNAIEAEGLITKIRDDADMLAYGLSSVVKDRAKIDFHQQKKNIIILDKATGKIEFRMEHKNSEIEALFRKYQEVYRESDLREIALKFMDDHNGIRMRKDGGIYFLPEQENSEKLRAFFTGAGSEFHDIALNQNKSNHGEVRYAAAEDFKRDLETAAGEVEFYSGKDNTRESTLATRLQRFQQLRQRAEAYRDLVQLDTAELDKTINALRERVEQTLLGDKKSYPQQKQFPYKSRVRFIADEEDELYKSCGTIIGYDTAGKGKSAEPIVKVLFDSGELVRVYAYEDNLQIIK